MAVDWLHRFQDFSKTVDFVDDDIFEDVSALLEKAFRDTWKVCFFRVLMSGHSIRTAEGDVPALGTIWSQDDSTTDFQIAGSNGSAFTLTTYAYLNRKPMWITAKDGRKLNKHTGSSDGLVDQWTGSGNPPPLPPYIDYRGSVAKTMVVLPLEYGPRLFGVASLEFSDNITISSRAKNTARMFAESLGRLIWLHETNKTQLNDSKEALALLHDNYHSASDAFHGRRVFLASSGEESNGPVVSTILSVLQDEFSDSFQLDYWAEERASGGINDQVRAAIASAEFGICYLSERNPDKPGGYIDNPNVLFEAGMFQMLHELRDNSGDANAARWLPIREPRPLSPALPFDIAGDRMLTVPRNTETGEVDTDQLREDLKKSIYEILDALNIDDS